MEIILMKIINEIIKIIKITILNPENNNLILKRMEKILIRVGFTLQIFQKKIFQFPLWMNILNVLGKLIKLIFIYFYFYLFYFYFIFILFLFYLNFFIIIFFC